MIEGALARHRADPNGFDSVLEFGVGCGRIIRHWRGLEGEVHGTDYNSAAVDWCAGNLRFATFRRNELAPPLPYPDGKFGFAYAYSVFTHLPENLQEIWLAELRRVVREGGLVLFTTHGNRFADARLTGEELERFRRGELVVRGSDVPGSNRCAAFHPQAYVREHLARGFDVLELRASTADGPSQQDVYLLQRQSSHSSWSK
jgi:SAM-dependent methyltransferase